MSMPITRYTLAKGIFDIATVSGMAYALYNETVNVLEHDKHTFSLHDYSHNGTLLHDPGFDQYWGLTN